MNILYNTYKYKCYIHKCTVQLLKAKKVVLVNRIYATGLHNV